MKKTRRLMYMMVLMAILTSGIISFAATNPLTQWTTRALPPSMNNHYGAAYGDGTFMVTNDSGGVYTSTDGANWVLKAVPNNVPTYSVAYGSGVFIVVSLDGSVLKTTDAGVNWTSIAISGSSALWDITYGNNTFMVVDGSTGVYTSTNGGSTWVDRSNANLVPLGGIDSVAYGNDLFVVVGSNGTATIPVGGNIWTISPGNATVISEATYGNELFVAVGSGGKVLTSANGIIWFESAKVTNENLYSVTFGNNCFAAVGDKHTVITSSDGVNWVSRQTGTNPTMDQLYLNITWGKNTFVAVGSRGNIIQSSLLSGDISGYITSGGQPLSGASVILTVDGTPYSTTSDSSGLYSFAGVVGGRGYTITVSKTGYSSTTSSSIGVVPGETTTVADLSMAVVNQDQLAPTGLSADIIPLGMYYGEIKGTTTAMEYKLATESDTAYQNCTASETVNLACGTYDVRYKAYSGFNASLATQVTLTIEPSPLLSINDVTMSEGDAGTTAFTFTVAMNKPVGLNVSFHIATNTVSADSNDYTDVNSKTCSIRPGQTGYSFTVLINGDTSVESDETFYVFITSFFDSGLISGTVIDGTGVGTIVNDDVSATVTTQSISSIDQTTATGNGNITGLGSANPTQYGVVWNTTGSPTTADSKTAQGPTSSIGAFTASMTGLSPNTIYYVRAYATSATGISYGEEVSFTTLTTNQAPTNIALSTSAVDENVAANTTVGTLSSSAPDTANTFTYMLATGSGDGDNAAFTISGQSLQIKNSPDFETKNSYSVRIRTTDQGGLRYEKPFTITITDINEAPVAVDDSYSLEKNTTLSTNPGEKLMKNDIDVDNNALTAVLVTDAARGTLVLNVNGAFIYTPNTNYSGPDSFTYRVSDGLLNSNTATVFITINAVPTFTVTFNKNGGDVDATPVTKIAVNRGTIDTLPIAPSRTGFTFKEWNTASNGSGTSFTASTAVTANVTVYAQWTQTTGGQNNGGGSSETKPQDPVKPIEPPSKDRKTETASESVATEPVGTDGVASGKVAESVMTDLLGKTIESETAGKSAVIEIKVIAPASAVEVEIKIPRGTFDQVADKTKADLKVDLGLGSITFSAKAVDTISDATSLGEITITMAKVQTASLTADMQKKIGDRPVFEFTAKAGDQSISKFGGGSAQISVPYILKAGENKNAIVVYFIDNAGKLVPVRGKYDSVTGTVKFTTTHFSQYAINYNEVKFSDIKDDAWYKEAVGFIAARGITSGTRNNQFEPLGQLTRGQFITLVLRAYGVDPQETQGDNFIDAGNAYYTGYLAAAKKLGITEGVGKGRFAPDQNITRQEMCTLLYNTLKVLGELPQATSGKAPMTFSDSNDVASWATDAMTLFARADIISGNDGKISPKNTTNRAEMAQVLYNLLSR